MRRAGGERAVRVALFADSWQEVNGVARTCREWAAYAQKQEMPLWVGHAGAASTAWREGSVNYASIRRGEPKLRLDEGLDFDLAFWWRHVEFLAEQLEEFRPDLVHVTGPSDLGMMGLLLAHRMRLPLAASWHTNLHQYAARRLPAWLPMTGWGRARVESLVEEVALRLLWRFYEPARLCFAPNPELVRMLRRATGRPCHLMARGVDTELFHPGRRRRPATGGALRVGYVGRLSREKNVRMVADLAQQMQAVREQVVREEGLQFVFVGQGKEEAFLRAEIPRAEFLGVLQGEALAQAYADLDVLIFPSETDTYGNVVQEAMASGVPAMVSDEGGPQFLVEDGVSGFCCGRQDWVACLRKLQAEPGLHRAMREEARRQMEGRQWGRVFAGVYARYDELLGRETWAGVEEGDGRRELALAGAGKQEVGRKPPRREEESREEME